MLGQTAAELRSVKKPNRIKARALNTLMRQSAAAGKTATKAAA